MTEPPPDVTVSATNNSSVALGGAEIQSPDSSVSLRTGVYYDSGITSHRRLIRGDKHLEGPGRIVAIYNALFAHGMMEEFGFPYSERNDSEESSGNPPKKQQQHQGNSGRQKEWQEAQQKEQEETQKEEEQADESAEKLRNPEFHPYSVQIGETIVTSRRDHIALVRLGQLLKAYIKSHNDGSLSADAYNEILHRCINIVSRFRNERNLQRDEEGVVINKFSDETLQALIATQCLRKMARMAKHKKACDKQKDSN
ncbi:hypothetical protein RUND412_006466 [Rhizina undulata]